MKAKPLLKVAVTTTAQAEAAVSDLLERSFALPPTVLTKPDSEIVEVSVFLQTRRRLSAKRRSTLKQALHRIRDAGLDLGAGTIRARRLAPRDWAESWKRHFPPLEIGGRLLVKPSWSRRRAKRDQTEIVIDPGLGFGTGQHATTAFCLERIVASLSPRGPRSLIDIGTGSGILAIAAARLGFHPVEAFDCDPTAVEVARNNLRRNGVASSVDLQTKNLLRLPVRTAKRFDVVCANLLADLLIAQRRRLANRLNPGGLLLLAGILRTEFDAVTDAYGELGLQPVCVRAREEWQSGAFALTRSPKPGAQVRKTTSRSVGDHLA